MERLVWVLECTACGTQLVSPFYSEVLDLQSRHPRATVTASRPAGPLEVFCGEVACQDSLWTTHSGWMPRPGALPEGARRGT